jgi:hypothetical protein
MNEMHEDDGWIEVEFDLKRLELIMKHLKNMLVLLKLNDGNLVDGTMIDILIIHQINILIFLL